MKNVRTLIGLLGNYMESDNFDEEGNLLENSLEEFLIDAALQSAQDEIKDNNKVLLMTAHVSKGLEFPYVFVVCLDENIFPTGHAIERGNKGIEEERRLCYVAITRAKNNFSYLHKVDIPLLLKDTIPLLNLLKRLDLIKKPLNPAFQMIYTMEVEEDFINLIAIVMIISIIRNITDTFLLTVLNLIQIACLNSKCCL